MQIMQKFVGYVTWRLIFNKFRLFNFSEIFTVLLWNIHNSNSAKKSKNIFLDKNPCTIEIALVRPIFGHEFNLMVNIWEQNTETARTNGFWYGQSEQNIFT